MKNYIFFDRKYFRFFFVVDTVFGPSLEIRIWRFGVHFRYWKPVPDELLNELLQLEEDGLIE